MGATAIREKLHDFIDIVDDKKVKAIYTILEDQINERYEWWNDKDHVQKLEKQTEAVKSGSVQTKTWEEIKERFTAKRRKK